MTAPAPIPDLGARLAAGACSLLLAVGAPPAASAAAAETDPQARRLIEAYNARELGSPGFRKVKLELRNGETVTQTFLVINVWERRETGVQTAFVLEEPPNLKGTNYLLVETPSDPRGMEVYLHLPAGRRRVLSVQPSHFDVGLLGSDFGYRDVRMTIPLAGSDFRLAGSDKMLGRPVRVVDVLDRGPGAAWPRSRLYLSEEPPMLLGFDRFADPEADAPAKWMRVQGLQEVDGAWTETRIVIWSGAERSSVLSLLDFEPRRPNIPAEAFTSGSLPTLTGDSLQRTVRVGPPATPRGGQIRN